MGERERGRFDSLVAIFMSLELFLLQVEIYYDIFEIKNAWGSLFFLVPS